MKPVYSNIAALLEMETERHLINCVADRSNGHLYDEDLQELLMRMITRASRQWDGYVRDHMNLPIEPAIIELTGTMEFRNGNDRVYGSGTLFLTELQVDDWIQPQDNYNAIHIVREIVSDTELRLSCNFYGADIVGEGTSGPRANNYISGVPDEVEELINCYTCYLLWRRGGKHQDDDNPWISCKELFDRRVTEIQEGTFRFHSEDAGVIARKPSLTGERYDSGDAAEYEINKDSMRGFCGD